MSESDRHELYAKLEEVIGKEHAETTMSLLPPVGWADVATKHDLAELEQRLDAKFEVVEARFTAVDAKLDTLESLLSARIFRTALVVNIPTILASFALALTAIRLA